MMRSMVLLAMLALGAPAMAATKAKPTTAPTSAQVERGKLLFQHNCAPCHGKGSGDDGSPQLPGTSRLEAKYKGEMPGALELRTDLTADTLRYFVRNGAGAMPMFRKTEVSDADVDAIAVYLKSGKGAQPAK